MPSGLDHTELAETQPQPHVLRVLGVGRVPFFTRAVPPARLFRFRRPFAFVNSVDRFEGAPRQHPRRLLPRV